MSSIAIFPCTPTHESGIIGELSSTLTLKVYTDENLLRETAAQFDANPERLRKMLYSKTSVFNQFTLEREKAVNMFRLLLADKLSSPDQYLFYGFLNSLIPPQLSEVLRVVLVDKKDRRIERAMAEGQSIKDAQKNIRNHDISAFAWTDFLFQKEAYDSTLYDLVVPVEDLTQLVKQLPGVENVAVHTRKTYADNVYRQQKFELPSKVLFVDDEQDFVQTVSQRLISRDVGTYGVYDGKEALELIVEDQPEVMVLDLKMPGLHGIEVLRKTKELAPEIEVIILTGHGTIKDMDECMQLGAFAYMNKPIKRGLKVTGATRGEEAVDLVDKQEFDAIVIDLAMPGMAICSTKRAADIFCS